MFNVSMGLSGHKRLVAVGLSGIVVISVFAVAFLLTFSAVRKSAILDEDEIYILELSGFGTTVARINAEAPVDVCITDSTGLRLLESGENALCYYYSRGVTEERIVWRQPHKGKFYLVIISGDEKAEVEIDVRSGLLVI
ncbi:hypothetical protein [Thermococcus stetteri]|uniref:hypothetical protein n=1 Tax=Thermococcus stetteri TaxID=49900 RepID=UPI001AE93A84|nr:hypothetical protein [Thermococcus stetteri]MBP1910772.1 hypothetical protein [Thermococcus stetteri]